MTAHKPLSIDQADHNRYGDSDQQHKREDYTKNKSPTDESGFSAHELRRKCKRASENTTNTNADTTLLNENRRRTFAQPGKQQRPSTIWNNKKPNAWKQTKQIPTTESSADSCTTSNVKMTTKKERSPKAKVMDNTTQIILKKCGLTKRTQVTKQEKQSELRPEQNQEHRQRPERTDDRHIREQRERTRIHRKN